MTKLPAILFASLSILQATCAMADTPLEQRLDAALAPMFKPNWPGATVIVTRDGKPVFRKAYGLANVAENTPMQPDMQLRIGSITKQFTAVGILMLAEQGKLSVTDDVRKYLPDFPDKGSTIRECLSLAGNPSANRDWHSRREKDGRSVPVTFLEWARTEGRFRKHFDKEGNPVTELIQQAKEERLRNWWRLQELAGVENADRKQAAAQPTTGPQS